MDIKAPDLGVDSAEVSEIMVEVGDVIAKDDNIVLLESDKASVEVPAPVAGKIEKILVEAGDMVANGQDFIVIMASGTDDASDSESETPKPQESAPAKKRGTYKIITSYLETGMHTSYKLTLSDSLMILRERRGGPGLGARDD